MNPSDPSATSVAVVIATYRRPDDVGGCLDALASLHKQVDEVVVVDSSPDDRTRQVVAGRPGVRYLRSEAGVGTTATSRAIGVAATTSDVVAFIDDDSIVRPTWLGHLLAPYADPRVGAVGGRVVNSEEEVAMADPSNVGRLLPDGRLTGNFAANPGRLLEVDHLLGANMSYRRAAIDAVGGIRDLYPGTCAREDSDLGLRMRSAGWKVVFAPESVVDHHAGEYAKGKRFDRRYHYYTQRNHVVLLSSVYGLGSPYVRRYWARAVRDVASSVATSVTGSRMPGPRTPYRRLRNLLAGLTRAAADAAGLLAGGFQAMRLRGRRA